MDALIGGGGNDTFVLGADNDTVSDSSGIDTITSTITRTLASYAAIENLTLLGVAAINGTGNTLNNVIIGNEAANSLSGAGGNDTLIGGGGGDTLSGGTGDDVMTGGDGSDIYYVDTVGDVVTETNANTATGGADRVLSSINYTLGANVEYLFLTGAAAINGTGNELANIIEGNNADNVIDGGLGADTLRGLLGNDTYVLGADTTDTIIDTGGIDTITSTITRSLAGYAAIENLTLLGSAAINGTGNALDNTITGNAADNTLDGGVGNDILNGGSGFNLYRGGAGNDTFNQSPNVAVSDGGRAEYTGATGPITVNLGTGGNNFGTVSGDASVGTDTLNRVDWVQGTNFNDIFVAGNTYLASDGSTFNEFTGGGGNDTITGNGATRVAYQNAAASVTVDLEAGTGQSTLAGDVAGVGFDTFSNVNQIRGSAFDDILLGSNSRRLRAVPWSGR